MLLPYPLLHCEGKRLETALLLHRPAWEVAPGKVWALHVLGQSSQAGARLPWPPSAPALLASVSCSRKWDSATRLHVLGGLSELVCAKHLVSMELDIWGIPMMNSCHQHHYCALLSQISSISEIWTDSSKIQNWERMEVSASPDLSTLAQRPCL